MTPDKKTQLYLTAAAMGFAASILLLCAMLLRWPDFWLGACIGVLLVSLLLIVLRSLRDEYIEGLWRTGTSAAFVVVVASFVFSSLHEGVSALRGAPDLPSGFPAMAAIVAFYLAFHVKWLRGPR